MLHKIDDELSRLVRERILVLDGAMGSMIQKLSGGAVSGCCDMLCLEKPGLITGIHEAYLCAGADIISTCSFNANAVSLADYGLSGKAYSENEFSQKAYEISRAAGELARKAADRFSAADKKRFVAGSMGPTSKSAGICQDINDPGKRSVTWDTLEDAYYDNARGLLDGGADMLLLETIFDTLNAKAAIAAVMRLRKERNEHIPLIISATIANNAVPASSSEKAGFDDQANSADRTYPVTRLLSGQSLEAFIVSIAHAEPFSLGLNCSFGAEKILPHLASLSAVSPFPVICYPNAGFPDRSGCYSEGPEQTALYMKPFFEQGLVNIAGGCCGTTPEHIAAIAELAKNYPPRLLREQETRNSKAASGRQIFLAGLEVFPIPGETDDSGIYPAERLHIICDQKLSELIKNGDPEDAVDLAIDMIDDNGDKILCICLDEGFPGSRETIIRFLNMAIFNPVIARRPVMLKFPNIELLEAALKCIPGRSLVDITNLKDDSQTFSNVNGDDFLHYFTGRYGAVLCSNQTR